MVLRDGKEQTLKVKLGQLQDTAEDQQPVLPMKKRRRMMATATK